MALVKINLSDPVSSLVSKVNTLSTNTGDLDSIEAGITEKASFAKALNFVFNNTGDSAQIIDLIDSAYVKLRSTGKLSVNNTAGTVGGTLAFVNSGDGVITLTGPSKAEVRAVFVKDSAGGIGFDSSQGRFFIPIGTVIADRFKSRISLQIKDSSGSVLKTIHSPGV